MSTNDNYKMHIRSKSLKWMQDKIKYTAPSIPTSLNIMYYTMFWNMTMFPTFDLPSEKIPIPATTFWPSSKKIPIYQLWHFDHHQKQSLHQLWHYDLPSEKIPMWAIRSCSRFCALRSSRLFRLSLDSKVHTLMAKSTSLGRPDSKAFSSLWKSLCLTRSVDIPTTLLPWAVYTCNKLKILDFNKSTQDFFS